MNNKIIRRLVHTIVLLLFFFPFAISAEQLFTIKDGYYNNSDIDGWNNNLSNLEKNNLLNTVTWTSFSNFKIPHDKNSFQWIKLTLPDFDSQEKLLYLESIHFNFQLFCEGKLYYQYGRVDGVKNPFVGCPPHYINLEGINSNTLYLRIYSHRPTIGIHGKVLYGHPALFHKRQARHWIAYTGQCTVLLFLCLISLFLFFLYQRETLYLIFALTTFFLTVFILFRSGLGYFFTRAPNQLLFYYMQYIALFAFIIFLIRFMEEIAGPGVFKINRRIWQFLVIFSVAILTTSLANIIPLPLGIYYFELICIPLLFIMIGDLLQKFKTGTTEIKIFSIGLLSFTIFGLGDVYTEIIDYPFNFPLVNFGFISLLTSIIIIIGMRIVQFRKKIEHYNKKLEVTNNSLEASEQKYRIIVEATNDFIFTLDENFQIITTNKSFRNAIMYHSNSAQNEERHNIFNYIYEIPENLTSMAIIREKLKNLLSNKLPFSMKLFLKSKYLTEPIDVNFRFEIISRNNKLEILARGAKSKEDALVPFFNYENMRYLFTNNITLTDEITQRITRNLIRYIDKQTINNIRVGLRELLVNSIEHGNLAISYNEKSEALQNQNYFNLLLQRKEDPNFKNRMIQLEYTISPTRAEYWITDEGEGFDFEKVLTSESIDPSHGHGITMAKNIFDYIEYLENGKCVHLTKYY